LLGVCVDPGSFDAPSRSDLGRRQLAARPLRRFAVGLVGEAFSEPVGEQVDRLGIKTDNNGSGGLVVGVHAG
jgi:hypothetical protein